MDEKSEMHQGRSHHIIMNEKKDVLINPDSEHNCDLFLLSSHNPYYARECLTEFAILGSDNTDGWGIGSYESGTANVIRSSQAAYDTCADGPVSREFKAAMNATCSSLILGHLRKRSSGPLQPRVENNHPFKLNFLGYDWLLIHNGTAYNKDNLVPLNERILLDSDSDTPRVFEFMRKRMIAYCASKPARSLIDACCAAYKALLKKDKGSFNIILSNGYLSFAFIHWRSFYLLNREKQTGDVALLSTKGLSEKEGWIEFIPDRRNKAKMLVFNGSSLIFNTDLRIKEDSFL